MTMVHIAFSSFKLKLIVYFNFKFYYFSENAYVLFKTKKVLYMPKRKTML